MHNRPSWYTNEHDSAWDRIRGAFRNDWDQTKHDFGSKASPDLDQDVDDTLKQMAGSDDFESHEPAFRFGHAARRHYGSEYASWNDDLERQLKSDYGENNWDRDRSDVRRAWEYRYPPSTGSLSNENRPNR